MLINDIHDLIAAPTPAASAGFLARVDATLTDGYAEALQLEAERARLERRLSEIITSRRPDSNELAALAERSKLTTERIVALRALLRTLRDRRAEIRRAA